MARAITCDAKIQLRRPSKWTKKGRQAIADWMRQKAAELEDDTHAAQLADNFTARYNPDRGTEK